VRRGIVYTIIAVVLLIAIGNIFFTQSRLLSAHTEGAAEERVRSVNSFIYNLEGDSNRAAYIAGFRTMIAMEQYITSTGQPLSDIDSTFREIFLNGSYGNMSFVIMDDSSFNEYLARVQQEAAGQGIGFSGTVTRVGLWQVDPWNILVNYTLVANISDERGTANWTIERNFTGRIPIIDLRDPLFTARTYGRIQRVIKPTNVSYFVNDAGDLNDTANLMRHFNSSSYIAAKRGPSILMRFAGNLSDSEFGIESLVDTDEFTTQNLPVNSSASVVDYLYFNGTLATACTIQNLPSRIKLDNAHLEVYEVQGELTYSTC
jgi:hypothetical protein